MFEQFGDAVMMIPMAAGQKTAPTFVGIVIVFETDRTPFIRAVAPLQSRRCLAVQRSNPVPSHWRDRVQIMVSGDNGTI